MCLSVRDCFGEVREEVVKGAVVEIDLSDNAFDLLPLVSVRQRNVLNHDLGVDYVKVPESVGLFKNRCGDLLLRKKPVEVSIRGKMSCAGFLCCHVLGSVVYVVDHV